ncbi:MAG: universal stress protein [Gordonia sp. (in: high G+C Gram-positive bacteria)]|uniref:universal stress protein n=1 Tax=Gordonia TaxID=2053 RepID=UPI0032674AA5
MMSGQLPVVVAVDGSEHALNAVRWAARTAALVDAPLQVISVTPPYVMQFSLTSAYAADTFVNAARNFAEAAVATAAEEAAAAAPKVAVTTEIIEGAPALTLRDVSHRARLLVLGRRGLGGVRGLLMGSVSTDAVAHANCPVVVISGATPESGPVVVGVDGSPVSTAAIGAAFEWADWLRSPLTAVHTYGGTTGAAFYPDEFERLVRQLREEAAEALGSQLAGYRENHPDVTVEPVVREGPPAEAIADLAETAQLVVLGSRGRGGFRGLVLGSTSQAVLQTAACPVMVVHGS